MSGSIRFVSTRDAAGAGVGFEEALLGGLAPDGGLYVPDRIPPIGATWRTVASLADAAEATLAPWFSPDEAAPSSAVVSEHRPHWCPSSSPPPMSRAPATRHLVHEATQPAPRGGGSGGSGAR